MEERVEVLVEELGAKLARITGTQEEFGEALELSSNLLQDHLTTANEMIDAGC